VSVIEEFSSSDTTDIHTRNFLESTMADSALVYKRHSPPAYDHDPGQTIVGQEE
jgi:hypothetical protein